VFVARFRPIGVRFAAGLLPICGDKGRTVLTRLPGREVVVIESLHLPVQVSKNLGDGTCLDLLRGRLAAELGFRPFGLFLSYGHQQNEEDEPERGSGGDQDGGTTDLSGWKEPFWIWRDNGIGIAHYIFWLKR
jgi:hypothetical protein